MRKHYGIVASAALAVGGMAFVGCSQDHSRDNPPATVGGVSGGGSTDSYGTSSNARYRTTGNIGVDTGAAPSNNGVAPPPTPPGNGDIYNRSNNPGQTPVGPAGSTSGAAGGTSTSGNTGNFQGGASGRDSGATVRTEVNPPANNNANGTGGATIGGTAGNGTSYNNNNAPARSGSETGRSETGRSETSGTSK